MNGFKGENVLGMSEWQPRGQHALVEHARWRVAGEMARVVSMGWNHGTVVLNFGYTCFKKYQ